MAEFNQQKAKINSRKAFEATGALSIKQIIKKSMKSLKKDQDNLIEQTRQDSIKENIEDEIMKMSIKDSMKHIQQLSLVDQIMNLGFPKEIAQQASFAFNDNPNADMSKVLNLIYSSLGL